MLAGAAFALAPRPGSGGLEETGGLFAFAVADLPKDGPAAGNLEPPRLALNGFLAPTDALNPAAPPIDGLDGATAVAYCRCLVGTNGAGLESAAAPEAFVEPPAGLLGAVTLLDLSIIFEFDKY